MASWPTTAAYAAELDAVDPLARFRDAFVIAGAANGALPQGASLAPLLIYLDGNSLGRLPRAAVDLAQRIVQQEWGERLIRSWNEGWYTAPERVGAAIGRLIGAEADEVIVADATSVNLFKLAAAALRARPDRKRILTDDLNFPSDLYILQGLVDMLGRGHRLEIVPSADGIHGPAAEIAAAMDEDVALLALSHTAFKSGYTYDLAALTAAAHDAGALVLWDLSHSAGALPIDLAAAGADLAVGCTYKYLNGGPGAPAFLYVRRDLQDALHNPISGWMGQQRPFGFDLHYQPVPNLRRFLSGTPAILSLSLIGVGVELLLEADMAQVRAKSVQQSEYLIGLWQALLAPLGFDLRSPRDPAWRGSHVALAHAEGWRINQALIQELQVLPDFRPPDAIRFGIAPLYTSYTDLHAAVMRLRRVVTERLFERYDRARPAVT